MLSLVDPQIEDYCRTLTHAAPAFFQELEVETQKRTTMPQMQTGLLEGRFLKMLVQLSGARRVLEIGTFTGYSALSMAEGLPEDGEVITCDVSEEFTNIARKYFAKSPHGHKIKLHLQPALKTIAELSGEFDLVFIDADKGNYRNYYEACLPKVKRGGLIVFDNSLWSGKVLVPGSNDTDARVIADVNELVSRDERVENVLLTVRDGMNLVRKI